MGCRMVVEEDLLAAPAAECSNPIEGSVSAATPLTVAEDEKQVRRVTVLLLDEGESGQ
jgi:hypothetical protein